MKYKNIEFTVNTVTNTLTRLVRTQYGSGEALKFYVKFIQPIYEYLREKGLHRPIVKHFISRRKFPAGELTEEDRIKRMAFEIINEMTLDDLGRMFVLRKIDPDEIIGTDRFPDLEEEVKACILEGVVKYELTLSI